VIARLGIPLAVAAVVALLAALTLGLAVWPFVFGGVLVFLLRQRR
jgi:hypothetical protein